MLVRDIMSKELIVVHPTTPLVEVARIIFEHNFNGLPVTDDDGKLLGLVTQQDLISHTNSLHLPTLINLLSQLKIYQKDNTVLKDDLKKIMGLTVAGIMNHEPLTISEDETVAKAAELFAAHHAINPLPVVNKQGILTGILSRYDIVKFFVGPTGGDNKHESTHEAIDVQIDSFVKDFQSRFLLISRSRTRIWLWLALTFGIVGFLIAWFLILRVNTQSY